ncbi:Glyoxylate reductase [Ignisphaera aggregans DSM 17230]|uniref:Glyoxylate reductase n=1 Tax=Ignisphaera aggregans (strain DSM 17230 / JCM 13409 / AQ1.S1) TaxID=583356 RepID=E0SR66_IGNAA|nr:Glyoxylate reductase [Ignisphaera aggregans DSM 17230]
MTFKIIVTYRIDEEGLKLLKSIGDVFISEKMITSEDELIKNISDTDAVLAVRGVEPFTRRVLESAPKLKIIARHGVGYDKIDVNAANELGIWVTIAPVNASTVAEHTIALIMALAKKLFKLDRFVRDGVWYKERMEFPDLLGIDLAGRVLGIIGLGRIGQEVAKRALALGMKVIYYDIVRREDLERTWNIEYRSLNELLRTSDFVSIHVPLTNETYHMIGEKELRLMKPTAYLVNTARGAVIDTDALVKALKEGWIAGAGLDVFEEEPLPPNHPLTKLDNVILTPHAASLTIECRRRLAITAAEEIIRVLRGGEPRYPVNRPLNPRRV